MVAEGYWEPYGPAIPHMLFSLSKSFTSTAVGMLVGEGRLSVDDRVLDFFPGEAPARRARAAGDAGAPPADDDDRAGRRPDPADPAGGRDWVRGVPRAPVPYEPGERFVYNRARRTCSRPSCSRRTGQRLLDYLRPRLFAPLGIESPTWETSQGDHAGGCGLKRGRPDVARFGQLYLQKGAWQGRQLVPAAWVAAATAPQMPNGPSGSPDWEQGYGYQFWRCRHGAYRGDGAFGQFCLVLPEQDAVVAITSASETCSGCSTWSGSTSCRPSLDSAGTTTGWPSGSPTLCCRWTEPGRTPRTTGWTPRAVEPAAEGERLVADPQ